MPSSCSLLRSSFLLVLTLIMLLDSRKISQDDNEAFLGSPYHPHIISTPLEANAGPGEDTPTFPQVEATFLMDYKTQATRVWPESVILDYMRHQLRFKGRTKKSTKKGYIWRFTV